MSFDFSTIEHDFLHVKDYFSNYKFTYKERRSKLDFLQNICNEPAHDTTALISSSKQQLVEVKSIFKNTDIEIKDLSEKIHLEKQKFEQKQKLYDELYEEEEELKRTLVKLKQLNEAILQQDKLKEEFNFIENDINKTVLEIESISNCIDPALLESKKTEEMNLREERNDLASKQRRLTIINTDNYMEDIYCWKQSYLEIIEKIFGVVTFVIANDKFTAKIAKNESFIEIVVKGKSVIDAYLSKNHSQEVLEEFEKIKQFALLTNNIKIILFYFSSCC